VPKIEEAEGEKLEARERREVEMVKNTGLLAAVSNEQDLCNLKHLLIEEQRGGNTIILEVIQIFRKGFPIPDPNLC
jgi:hypothetical protein